MLLGSSTSVKQQQQQQQQQQHEVIKIFSECIGLAHTRMPAHDVTHMSYSIALSQKIFSSFVLLHFFARQNFSKIYEISKSNFA